MRPYNSALVLSERNVGGLGMALDLVFEHIERRRDAFIERLCAYLRMPSISAQGIGIQENAEFLVSFLSGMGLQARLIETPGWPLVYARRDDVPGGPRILLYGHYDVQPPDPLDHWVSPPFGPRSATAGSTPAAPATTRGSTSPTLLAIESLLAVNGALPCNVTVLLEGEEEIGSPHIAEFVRAHRDLLDVDLVITSDGPVHDSGRSTIEFGVRGVARFELRAKGANRDLHSGNFGGVAPNPIWTLVHALATMKNPAGEITIDGFYDSVVPPTDLEREAIAAMPDGTAQVMADLGLTRLDAAARARLLRPADGLADADDQRVARRLWRTRLEDGAALARRSPSATSGWFRDQTVAEHLREDRGAPAEARAGGRVHPRRRHGPLEDAARFALRRADPSRRSWPRTGEEPLLVPAMGGSLPEYVWTKILGIPAFVVPYANHDEQNHAPNENIEVDRFITGIKIGAALLTEVGGRSTADKVG